MRYSFLAIVAVVFLACVAATESSAHAEQFAHPSGFKFELPASKGGWKQQVKGDLIVVTESETHLEFFVFPPKREGSITDLTRRLAEELKRPGVGPGGKAIAGAKVASYEDSEVEGAQVRFGLLGYGAGDDDAKFAIVQRGGRSLLLVGFPAEASYRLSSAKFQAVARGLQRSTTVATTPAPSNTSTELPVIPAFVAIKSVTASSTFADKKDLYAAWRTLEYTAVDDVPTTAWCEGKPDEGVGETISIELAAATQLDSLKVAAGVWKSAKLLAGNNRITALDVTLDGKTTTVKPTATREWVKVPIGRAVTRIAIKLAAVTKGKMNDSCISGIALVRDNETIVAVRVEHAASAALPTSLVALQKALETRVGLEKLLDFPFGLDVSAMSDEAPEAISYANWKAVDAACKRADKVNTPATNLACPQVATVDDEETSAAIIRSAGPAQIDLEWPSHREQAEHWRLKWRDGAWRLAAVTFE